MENENIYFGIRFPVDFGLAPDKQRELAKLLFISPTTSAKEAKKIINNSKLISVINLLIENLSCELEKIQNNSATVQEEADEAEFAGADDDEKTGLINIEKIILDKLADWIDVFGTPTEEEINEVRLALNVSRADAWISLLRDTRFRQLDSPSKISEYLSLYVVGQPEAVKIMSIIINEQKMRLKNPDELLKSSALFIGESGVGKSLLVNKGKEILNTPMVRISSGELVPSGVVGNTINKYLTLLYQSANEDTKRTSKGILYFDEIDKISKYYHSGDDDWKTTIQLEILKLFDLNEKICFPSTHEQWAKPTQIMTNDLLLLFSGAFSGIDAIILSRLAKEFDGNLNLVDKTNLMHYCNTEDIQMYGIIPELTGRLSYICPLNSLKGDDIYNIMTTAKDSDLVKHLKKCEMLGISLRLSDDALRLIADHVVKQKLGARYINTMFNTLLKDVYFNSGKHHGKEVVIDKKFVARALNYSRNKMIYDAFDRNMGVGKVAENYKLSLDAAFDIYLEWKSLK